MAKKYTKGIYVKAIPEFHRQLTDAAKKAKEPISTYVRTAIEQRIKRQDDAPHPDLRPLI